MVVLSCGAHADVRGAPTRRRDAEPPRPRTENQTPRGPGNDDQPSTPPRPRLARLVDAAPPPLHGMALGLVVIGACLAPTVNTTRLVATLLAFFFAVGLAAHSLDELNGRPLGTHILPGRSWPLRWWV